MSSTQIREELKDYIELGDTQLLELLHSVAKKYHSEDLTKKGEPLSLNELRQRVQDAQSRIKSGHFTTQEDLEEEAESW
ncbi:MAG: hypothetical protein HOP30_03060 [Cyclobacteriaceae bacterium]|nr:hypothetical protein [Cyclobacteriaceae bacterium]